MSSQRRLTPSLPGLGTELDLPKLKRDFMPSDCYLRLFDQRLDLVILCPLREHDSSCHAKSAREILPGGLAHQCLGNPVGTQVKAAVRFLPLALLGFRRRRSHLITRLALEKDVILPVLDEHPPA